MREIKFMAWDKITKKVCEVWEIAYKGWDGDGQINYVRIGIDGVVDRMENEVELIQFTGLKDKNGKEIYEGDILSWYDGRIVGEVTLVQDGNELQYVLRRPPEKYYPEDHDIYNLWNGPEVEIIGNIYENPELLIRENDDAE